MNLQYSYKAYSLPLNDLIIRESDIESDIGLTEIFPELEAETPATEQPPSIH